MRNPVESISALMDYLPDATLVVDREARVVLANEQACEMFGYAADELIGQPIEQLVPDSVADRHRAHRDAFITRPSHRPMGEGLELHGQRSDGELFPVGISLSKVGDGDELFVLCSARDLTVPRRLERRLWSTQRLEAIGRLAGGVAHEFNNLLSIIQSYAAFLSEKFDDDEQAVHDLDAIMHAAGRAAELTAHLLAFGRGQFQALQTIDVNERIRAFESVVEPTLPGSITLVMNLDPDVAAIEVDPGQFEQVLLNLVLNAQDAMSDGGTLTISTRNTTIERSAETFGGGVLPSGEWVVVSVVDEGSGMDAETASRAFEPFFSTRDRGDASGLGLSTAFGIVSQSHGHIWVETEPGKGATFHVAFPPTELHD